MKLFIDPAALKSQYAASPAWLKTLMNAFADGLNFYLAKHPEVKPRVIQHFEPWMALSFTEGSIGGDIERVNLNQLQAFYGKDRAAGRRSTGSREGPPAEPGGSNGMAIAPSNTSAHHALLLINPHTSFFFRSELQMVSEEGLNAYGAVTWGQFFIYQGFNERAGWMHTSSGVDAVDEYLETVEKKGERFFYKYGNEERPLVAEQITVPYQTGDGDGREEIHRLPHASRAHRSRGQRQVGQHPPDAGADEGADAILHAHQGEGLQVLPADHGAEGQLVEQHDLRRCRRRHRLLPRQLHSAGAIPSFDWTKPVDGSNPATEWQGLLAVDETPHLLNPKSGWLYNTNNWPWSAAGPSSPKQEDYPAYVENGGESARGLHAIRVLENKKDFTLDSLIAAAYDSYLTWFEKPIPALIKAWDEAAGANPLKAKLAPQIELLRKWDLRWAANSVPTSLAVFWGEDIRRRVGGGGRGSGTSADDAHRQGARGATAAIARGGVRQARGGLRKLEDAVGRDQSLPAAHRRHRAAVQRRRAEHSGGLHVRACGDRWLRSARARIRGRRSGTAPAATASSRWWSSATACGPRP